MDEITMDEQTTGVNRLSQAEANYVTAAKSADVSCATCRWFDKATDYCGIVKATPVDIVAEGGCDRHESKGGEVAFVYETANAELDKASEKHKANLAIISDNFKKELEQVEQTIATSGSPTIIDRVKAVFARKPDDSAFQVFKAADGKHYWLARHTNNFEDRDKEILSQKAHEAYVARVNLGFVPPPELWAYHTKGTAHGTADQVWMHQNFVFALGHFDDTPEAQQAIKWYQSQKGNIELSHGFTFPKWALKDGVYETYNTFEISTLPTKAASNPYTAFEEIDKMALSEKQANWIKSVGGEAMLKRVQDAQSVAEKDADVLKAIDAKYKDFVETETKSTDTPSESIKAGDGEVIKTLLADMIAVTAAAMEDNDSMKAEITAFKTEIAAFKAAEETATKERGVSLDDLKAKVAALQAQLDARPKSASTAAETQISKDKLPEEVTTSMVKRDGFWGVDIKE